MVRTNVRRCSGIQTLAANQLAAEPCLAPDARPAALRLLKEKWGQTRFIVDF